MAQVIRVFAQPIRGGGLEYHARVVGRAGPDNMWEAWLEFVPLESGGEPVVSAVESRQPKPEHLQYWAEGLSVVYAEGSLARALHQMTVRAHVVEKSISDGPATRAVAAPPRIRRPQPVLDPFAIGGRNLDILRQELHALNRRRLLSIITAYGLDPGAADLKAMSDSQLVAVIVSEVGEQLSRRTS